MKIAITGANGFIGNELAGYFLRKGHEVVLLQRRPPADLPKGTSYQPYDLQSPDLPDITGVNALIHAAYVPATKGINAAEANITGSLKLYEECVKKDVDYIFLSSMSAHKDALSQYGKHKYETEKTLQQKGNCLVLKLGLVLGAQGLFSRIRSTVQKTSFAVMVGGGNQPIQTIYIKDVAQVLEKCIENKVKGTYTIATPRIYTMRELFSAIAKQQGKSLVFVPVPYFVAEAGIGLIELLRLPFPVSNENLLGLKQLQAVKTQSDLEKLGVTLTDLPETLQLLK